MGYVVSLLLSTLLAQQGLNEPAEPIRQGPSETRRKTRQD